MKVTYDARNAAADTHFLEQVGEFDEGGVFAHVFAGLHQRPREIGLLDDHGVGQDLAGP